MYGETMVRKIAGFNKHDYRQAEKEIYSIMSRLHLEWVKQGRLVATAPTSSEQVIVFLHGLLGTGRNLGNLARKLTAARPELSGVLVDIRGHGKSRNGHVGPHTFQAAARDVQYTLEEWGIQQAAIVGHSMGGRLALQCAQEAQNNFTTTWLLDTVPGQAHSSVAKVIDAVSSIKLPVQSKQDLVDQLTKQHGLTSDIANWMSTNLENDKSSAGFRFNFDLEIVHDILQEFPNQDFYGQLHNCKGPVHVVRAGKNKEWNAETVRRLEEMPEHVKLHTLANAGHWVHVDALDDLVNLILPSLV